MANISILNSTYETGGFDSRDILNGDSDATFQQMNGAASGVLAIEAVLGDGPTLKGNKANLAERLNALMDANGVIASTSSDARTNSTAIAATFTVLTTSTPAANIGTAILLQAESQDETPSNLATIGSNFTVVTAGGEYSSINFATRVSGAALATTFTLHCGGSTPQQAFIQHAITAQRTYTLPDFSGTFLLSGTQNVGTAELKTATGSASVGSSATGEGVTDADVSNVTMNDMSFFPSFTYADSGTAGGSSTNRFGAHGSVADPNNQVGRIQIQTSVVTAIGLGAATWTTTATLRWKYITASDNPELWIARSLSTGRIKGVWVSDDPTPGHEPGLTIPGCRSLRLTARDLEQLSCLSGTADQAAAYIKDRKMRMEHQAYRALQLMTNDQAPSKWLLDHADLLEYFQ